MAVESGEGPPGGDLEFCVLGPLEVHRHGVALPPVPPMAALLVAYLLLGRSGTETVKAVNTTTLAKVLWSPTSPYPSSATAVHQLVARLRRILDPGRQARTDSSVIKSVGQSYRLDIDPVRQLDLERFREHVRRARSHLGDRVTEEIPAEEAASAVALLDAAEMLWRGDFLADLTHTDWVANVARVVEAEREVATELRLRARVAALPDPAEVVPELIALNERRPDWTGPVRDLMLALYRSGRTAEALEVHARHLEHRSRQGSGAHLRYPQTLDVLADRIRRSDPTDGSSGLPGGQPAGVGPIPVGPGPETAFVGRDDAFAILAQAVRSARAGTGQLVLLKGTSGIGKSRAAREFLTRAGPGVAAVIAGGWGAPGAPPLAPWRRMLRWAQRTAPDHSDSGSTATVASAHLESLLDEEVAGPQLLPRTATFHAAVDLLAATSRRQPLLVVLDDVQWMDEASCSLLEVLVGRLEEIRIVVVALCREPGAVPSAIWKALQARLETDHRVVVHRLTALGVDDVRALAHLASGEPPPETAVDLLASRSAGQPLVVTMLLQRIVEGGAFVGWARAQVQLGAVPENATQVLLGRMVDLSPAAMSVLDAAAVASAASEEVDPYVLKDALGFPFDELAESLEILAALGLIVPTGSESQFGFAHAFYREAVYTHLVGVRRERLHAELGATMERLYNPVPSSLRSQLAYHYQHGGHPARAKAIEATLASAEANAARLAHESSAAEFELAHDLADGLGFPPLQRADLLLRAAEAQTRAGGFQTARELCDRVHSVIGNEDGAIAGRLLANAALLFGAGLDFSLGNQAISRRNFELLHAARQRLDVADVGLRGQVLAQLAASQYWMEPEERETHTIERLAAANEGLDLARRDGDLRVLAHVLAAHNLATWSPDTLDARTQAANEIVTLGTRAQDVEAVLAGLRWMLICAAETGEIATLDEALDRYERTASRLGQPVHDYWVEAWRGMRALVEGRYLEAHERASRAHALSTPLEADDIERQNGVGALSQAILFDLGRSVEFEPMLLDYIARYPQIPAWRLGLSLIAVEKNDLETAAATYTTGWKGVTSLPRDAVWLYGLVGATEVVVRLGDQGAAATLYEMLKPYETRCAVASYGFVWGGPVALPLARLARVLNNEKGAQHHLSVARDIAERSGSVPFRARVAFETFLLLRDVGDPTGRAAASALEEAKRLAGSIGMNGLSRQLAAQRV
jgi:DNA-binding SARP family transcriptional activator